jgi:hypothetical protein
MNTALIDDTAVSHSATVLSPLLSEFDTQAQADRYDLWFRAKVQTAIDDTRPSTPHEAAVQNIDRMIEEKKAARAQR